jgi:hypothetical protein
MIIITKGMLALSALMSAGLIAAWDIAGTRAEDRTPAMQVTQRFPVASEMFSPVPMTQFVAQKFTEQQPAADSLKADKLSMTESCARQDWPYIAQECLVSADGKPVRKISRVITVERRISENSSELLRVPVADLAQR